MSEFKGTPGLWFKHGIDVYAEQNSTFEIAQAYSSSECSISEYTNEDWEEAHANAQLIATAPELLNEVQYLIKALKVINSFGATKSIIEHAESIVNKALGIPNK